jgi:hypothetical protein
MQLFISLCPLGPGGPPRFEPEGAQLQGGCPPLGEALSDLWAEGRGQVVLLVLHVYNTGVTWKQVAFPVWLMYGTAMTKVLQATNASLWAP